MAGMMFGALAKLSGPGCAAPGAPLGAARFCFAGKRLLARRISHSFKRHARLLTMVPGPSGGKRDPGREIGAGDSHHRRGGSRSVRIEEQSPEGIGPSSWSICRMRIRNPSRHGDDPIRPDQPCIGVTRLAADVLGRQDDRFQAEIGER